MRSFAAVFLTACVSYTPPGPDAGTDPDPGNGGSGAPADATPQPDPGNPAARAAFKQDVGPIQRDRCGYFCHGAFTAPVFNDVLDADRSYDTMIQFPAILDHYEDNAPVAIYAHLPASTGANYFDAAQLDKVRNWLRLERGY